MRSSLKLDANNNINNMRNISACNEVVTWLNFARPIVISQSQVRDLSKFVDMYNTESIQHNSDYDLP